MTTFFLNYKHDRRKHRHRCPVCDKCLNTGDDAFMAKVGRKTRALHEVCSNVKHPTGYTYRTMYKYWASYQDDMTFEEFIRLGGAK